MQELEQFSQFYAAHGLDESGSVTNISVEDGTMWLAEAGEHSWAISFYPYRSDHPDAPVVHVQVGEEELGHGADADAAEAWARERFEGRDPREFVLVHLEAEADPGDVKLIEALFDEAGTPAIVQAGIERRSAGELPWLVYIVLAGAGGRLGGALLEGLAGLVKKLYQARRGRGTVKLEDDQRTIVLESGLSDEAYRALEGLPVEGYFIWDASEQRWRQH